MSKRERMYQLLDIVPDSKLDYLIGFIEGLTVEEYDDLSEETLEAIKEIENGGGETFEGSTHDFIKMMLED